MNKGGLLATLVFLIGMLNKEKPFISGEDYSLRS
jgi:hypothetical protein